ncbi:MAG: carboxypeptidase regulatory-like domain-containing protein [Terriglobales bacterium]
MKRLQLCLAVFAVLALTFSAFAQVQNGQFSGTIVDPSGAAIANAKVSVSNPATGLTLTATTNSSGNYTVREVPPGAYKITVEAPGFKTESNTGVGANAGTISHVDFKLQVGKASEVVEVNAEAVAVNTEDSKLASTVSATQISNLPLNGRNVYDLIQLVPGAVNVTGVDMEAGHNTVVNGVREDFNGFLINGVSNKDLSGGVVNVPIEDTVEEFQQLQLNVSAQYGSSAGSINNLITKSGSNAIHGSAWDYLRNDAVDANEYFLNQQNVAKPPLHFNQFGFTVGGPIIKDKLFFFGSYQYDHFNSSGTPQTLTVESPEWRSAVETANAATVAAGGLSSVASLLYSKFAPAIPGTTASTLAAYFASPAQYNLPAGSVPNLAQTLPNGMQGPLCQSYVPSNGATSVGQRLQSILGVNAAEAATMSTLGCPNAVGGVFVGSVGFRDPADPNSAGNALPFENTTTAIFGTQTQSLGNLFNGNEASGRIDYTPNANNRFFIQFNWLHETDQYGPCYSYCTRGFTNPADNHFPTGQLSWVHTFSPKILNELRAGYTQNNTGTSTAIPGVPAIGFNDGTAAFGSYNGYPQFFKDHEYTYSDMVSISHGNHSMKVGADLRRNLENSQFNVARPSYVFFDPTYFAADAPFFEIAGVNPGFVNGGTGQAELETNIRHFRNWEIGAFFQDDWKVSKRLTLNLGLRWDLYTRHTELNNLATTFILGPNNPNIPGVAGQIADANVPFSTAPGPNDGYATTCNPNTVTVQSSQVLQGVCGPGGFAPTNRLGPNQYKDFGPRLGFAWDVFGDGKTSLRGGFGISYEGTLYNPLSNSRWNPPYYSFNLEQNSLVGGPATVVYGPTTCGSTSCGPSGATPTYTGPGTNPGMGTLGNQATGNITGYAGFNADTSYLTGIVFPQGIKDPYVYNFFLSIQREIVPKLVVEADYVGTAGHRLFRAENTNSAPGAELPLGATVIDNLGRSLTGLGGLPNPNYGILRTWENAVNSNYNALQLSVKKQTGQIHGVSVLFNGNYTWSHSIDNGSTWHSGATTANGGAAGEGYTTDQTEPGLDRGNSIYDIRQRVVLNYVIQLPGQNLKGALGAIVGGWSYNGIWAFQSGAHWMPFAPNGDTPNLCEPATSGSSSCLLDASGNSVPCSVAGGDFANPRAPNCINTGGDFNLNGVNNDRPNSTIQHATFNRSTWANGWAAGGQGGLPVLSNPCLACTGTMGRNNFVGPGQWYADMTLAKVFTLTERFHLKFEANAFNIFNRANFLLAVNGGGAHNSITDGLFGAAAGTLNARNMQFGLKLLF